MKKLIRSKMGITQTEFIMDETHIVLCSSSLEMTREALCIINNFTKDMIKFIDLLKKDVAKHQIKEWE